MAEQLEYQARELQAQAQIAGLKDDAARLVEPMLARARELREPEIAAAQPLEERQELTEGQRRFLRAGREEAAKDPAEHIQLR